MPLVTTYNNWLVALSLLVAVCAAYVSLGVAEGICDSTGRLRTLSIQGGAAIMGVAVWSMHYVGMLALGLPVSVRYDWALVLLSIAVSILASAIAFVLTGEKQLSRTRLALGSLAMGGGIAGMHYLGMAAMRMQCLISWNWAVVALSVVVAVQVSFVALASFRLSSTFSRYSKFAAAGLLGIAISSMHYVGMAAATFVKTNQLPNVQGTLSVSALGATGVGIVGLVILALGLGGSLLREYISKQSRRLAFSEERYRLLFEKALIGVYRVDSDGVILDINAAGARLLGYSGRAELIGRNLIREHFGSDEGHVFAELTNGRLEMASHEMQLFSRDGSKTYVMHSATSVEGRSGSPHEVQGFFLSIAELKWTEIQLRQAQLLAEAGNVAKRQFMTHMSHELRTPLNGILGMSEMLMHTAKSDEQRECISIVQQSGESLLASIDEILNFANESSPKPESNWEEFSLPQLIAGEVKLIELRAQRSGTALRANIDPACIGRYFSDTLRLRHILSALLSNALKFTQAGSIQVSAHSRPSLMGGYPIVSIAVSDTGVGIASHRQATIFDITSGINHSNGSGLGLSTVKAALSALHGTIQLQSDPGKGSTFTIELPLRPVPIR